MVPAFSRAVPDVATSPDNDLRTRPDAEFDAIETCLSTSERGRRFLAEYARRRQAEGSLRILAAIDRIEARTLRSEIERVRERMEADRVAEVARQLSDVLKELRPVADARARALAMEATPARVTPLERRVAALVQLDNADAEEGLKLFG
jgi:molecular chaperone GrpE (heat shock protein)